MAKIKSWTANPSNIYIFAISLGFLLVMGASFLTIDAGVDDAFIVYRYVDRFLEFKGLTYNDGEHVEGFTSLLWTLLLAAGSFISGIRPHIVSIWINYTLILLTSLCMIWLLQILRISRLLKVISLFLFAVSILYFKVVFLGLEFGLFTLLLILFFCFFLRSLDYPVYLKVSRNDSYFTGFLATALFATRPETIVLLPAFLFVVLLFLGRNKNIRQSLLYSGGSFIVFVVPVIVWRLSYFGELLPNSVIAKSIPLEALFARVAPFSRKLLINHGITYIQKAYQANPALLFTTVLIALTVLKKNRVFELSLLYMPILWQHGIILLNGGDWMEYARFINMFVPLFIIIFVLITEDVWRRSKMMGALSLLIFFGLYAYANIPFLNLSEKTYKGSFLDQFDSYQLVGQSLSDVWQENDILIPEATGRIAYYIPKAFVRDPSGLTDKVLAHDPTALRTVFGRGNWHYSLSLKPTMIVLHYWPHQMLWPTLGLGYPEQFAFYCLPARLNALEEQWLLIVVRRDKVDRYAPPLVKLGALKIAYEDFANMETDYLECGK